MQKKFIKGLFRKVGILVRKTEKMRKGDRGSETGSRKYFQSLYNEEL